MTATEYRDIPLADIVRNPDQPRKHFDPDGLAELAGSIAANGHMSPILVRPHGDQWIIVAGERRWRASSAAGLTVVPCRVVDLSESEAYVLSVAENVNRVDMTVLEETAAFAQLIAYGRDVADIARLFGKSEEYVRIRLSFESLVDEARGLLLRGEIRPNLARYLAELRPGNQRTVVNRFARGEFKNEIEATHFARSLRAGEDDEGFFLMEEPTEEDREIHRAKAAAARRTADTAERLAQVLRDLADTDATELAAILGDEVAGRLAQIERVTSAAQAARQNLRRAVAHSTAQRLAIRPEASA
jgi:ParB family chromosome partitioning protein